MNMKPTLLLFTVLISHALHAQVFPVHVSPQLVPPYSPWLSDYTAPGAQNFMVQIRANDITISDYPCRLRITIEGAGITIRTKPNAITQPLILEGGGIPQILYGDDLLEYFHPRALEFSGLSRSAYEKSARLPEGIYRFAVEVLDYHRGTVVSNTGTAMAWIILNDPPLLNLPTNFSKLNIQVPANLLFSWTPRHSGSPNSAFSTEYTFRLIEIWPENRNPYDAFLTQLPLFEAATAENQIVYGMTEPALIPGRKYAWQVEARDTGGKDLFKNSGRSEVFIFQFGEALTVPENFQLRWAKPTTLSMRWDPVSGQGEEVKYRLQYRPRLRREDHQWYETRTQFTEKTLYHLQPNTEYEMRVRSEDNSRESAYTDIRIFKTLPPAKKVFECKDPITPPPSPANTLPVFPLGVNDTVHAGGYDVLVRDVMEVDGKYFGSGVAIVPWFNAAKVRVTFENIRVNDRFRLTNGTIKSVWNVESQFLLEEQTPVLPGAAPHAGTLDITIVAADSLIAVEGRAIAAVTKDESGNIVVTATDGREKILPKGESYAIIDEVGNGYVVDKQGNIAKTTATEARAVAARGARKYDLVFRFAHGKGRYGFDEKKHDALSPFYQQLDDGSYVPWKALSSTHPDNLEGHLTSGDTDVGKIRFDAGASPVISHTTEPGKVTLNLQGRMAGMEAELLALYSAADTLPVKVVGKVNLATYHPAHFQLEIVPVNGASLPAGLSVEAISERLNKIYGQAVVTWRVNLAREINVDLPETFDEGETGVFSNYTDDMKKVLNAYGRPQNHVYYLFLIHAPRNPMTLGYMPRSKRAGFVFVDPHDGDHELLQKTIAHELGHGAFNLKHTFSEHNLPMGATDNVMDYSDGTSLYKYQWDHIHSPQGVIGLFEGDEDGGSVEITLVKFYHEGGQFLEEAPFKNWVAKFQRVNEFLKTCKDEKWESYNGKGIIPFCFWRNHEISSGLYYTNADLPFTAGIVDGAYIEADGIYQIPRAVSDITNVPGRVLYAYTAAYWECRTSQLIANYEKYEYVIEQLANNEKERGLWNWVREQWHDYRGKQDELKRYFKDCRDADDLRETIEDLYELATNWEEIGMLSSEVCQRINQYWITLGGEENIGRYQRGKLIFPTASFLLPFGAGVVSKVEKLKNGLKILKNTSTEDWRKFINQIDHLVTKSLNRITLNPNLKVIYDDCIKAGYKASDEGPEVFFSTADNVIVAKISDDALHIKIPHENGWATQSKTQLAKETFDQVKSSRKVYRLGALNKSQTGEAQYWSSENPFDFPSVWEYAKKYGIPEENLIGDNVFFEVGLIPDYVPYITREAPAFGINGGGAIEVVLPIKGVKLENFNTLKFEK